MARNRVKAHGGKALDLHMGLATIGKDRGKTGGTKQYAGSPIRFGTPSENGEGPLSLRVAPKGIRTSDDYRDLMSALVYDVIRGLVSERVVGSVCNACGKMQRMVEMEIKYGQKLNDRKSIKLAFDRGGTGGQ